MSVAGGNTSTGTVTLPSAAPTGGTTDALVVANASELIGFDPFVDFVDFLLERAGARVPIAR